MSQTKAHIKASAKYNAKNYKSFTVNAKIADYNIINDFCSQLGISKAQLIVAACRDYINRYNADNNSSNSNSIQNNDN